MRVGCACLLTAAMLSATSTMAQPPEPPWTFEITEQFPVPDRGAFYAGTARVNENGKRHDKRFGPHCLKAPDNLLWAQAKVREKRRTVKEESLATCYVDFADYKEIMPGVTEPKTACFTAFVVSVGGVVNRGKKGEIWCYFEGAYLNPDKRISPKEAAK